MNPTTDDVDIVATFAEILNDSWVGGFAWPPGCETLAEDFLLALRARGYDIVSSEPEKVTYEPPF